MNKGTKIALILSVILVALGCVMGGLGFAVSNGELTVSTEEKEKHTKRFSGEVSKIEVELRYELMELTVIPGEEYVVEYYDNGKNYFNVELDGDTLRVVRNDVKKMWYESIHIGFEEPGVDVRIGVPESFYGEVTLAAGSGGINVEGLTLEKPLTVAVGSGGVNFENIYCTELKVSASSGGVNLNSVGVRDNVGITVGSGAVRAEELHCGEELSAESGSGAIRLESCQADTVRLKVTSGSVRFEDFSYESSAYIRTSSGSVRGELTGREEDYSIRSHTGSGSCNLPSYRGDGKKMLDVSTGSGSIDINFIND